MIRLVARLLVVTFCCATSLYALVASSTFAYLQFLRPRVFPWTGVLADWHATLAWPCLALWFVVVSHDLGRTWRGRPLAWLLSGFTAGAVVANAWRPVLPALANDTRSLIVAVASLAPIVGLAALDLLRHADGFDESDRAPGAYAVGFPEAVESGEAVWLAASILTSVALSGVYAVLAILDAARQFEPDLTGIGLLASTGFSVIVHVTVFIAVFLAVALIGRMAGPRGTRSFVTWSVAIVAVVAVIFDRLINNALNVTGMWRPLLAGVTALAIAGTWTGLQLSRWARARRHVPDAPSLYLGAPGRQRRVQHLVGVAVIALLAWSVRRVTAVADWDDLVLRLGTMVVWIVAFGWAYRLAGEWAPRRLSTGRLALVCLAPLAALVMTAPAAGVPLALARYQVYDPSYRLARGLMSAETATPGFTRYLRAHTGLTDIELTPQSIDHVPALQPVPEGQRPPIFLFVVDSLRADYLAPYNQRVSFTPAIRAFADDSVVFRNAFTRYGGTGLSVPAIWAGSALPHKQYVTPFAPMNGLEKLLDANRYRRFIGLDSIMVQLLSPSPQLDELDKGVTVMDYELCRTLTELEGKLAASPSATSVFAYSLPQDVHMSRLGHWATPAGDFSGFFAPYAGRIQAMDACFGRFIGALKRLGLYDRSLIILTSDHGEMLGEDGQFGHSYHMFPPVVRVPLIVHLPASVAARARIDPDAIALSTDITPTIYATLGYPLAPQGPLLGRPLIGQDDEAVRTRRRARYVLAASYGAVYAVVSQNGRRLYVADGVKGEDHLYERSADTAWRDRQPTADERAIEQYAIRQHVDEVARVFALPERESR